MDRIPTEILYEILSHIREKDLPSARLFRTIRIPVSASALSNLINVSGRPELAQCVRHLMYPYQPMYPKKFVQEKELQRAGKFGKVLKFALVKMPNGKEITAELDGHWLGQMAVGPGWPESSILVGDVDFYTSESILPDSAEKDKLLGPFKELMAAAFQAHTRLEKLSITPLWRGIFTEGPELLLNMDFDVLQKDVNEGRIFRFLSSAPKLRSLAVGFHWNSIFGSPVSAMPLLQIFGDNYVWKYLEVFIFNGRQINGEDLTHFFVRHASTLKTFGLYRPYLRTGTWRAVLDSIKGHPELCLEKLILFDPSEISPKVRTRNYWSQS
ncbi:hypothetical protein RUND412_004270 [Rhizina undulata]